MSGYEQADGREQNQSKAPIKEVGTSPRMSKEQVPSFRQRIEEIVLGSLMKTHDPTEFMLDCDAQLRTIDPTLPILKKEAVETLNKKNSDYLSKNPHLMGLLEEKGISVNTVLMIGRAGNILLDIEHIMMNTYLDTEEVTPVTEPEDILMEELSKEGLVLEEYTRIDNIPVFVDQMLIKINLQNCF